jgi:hypothetical protein
LDIHQLQTIPTQYLEFKEKGSELRKYYLFSILSKYGETVALEITGVPEGCVSRLRVAAPQFESDSIFAGIPGDSLSW